MKEGKERIVPDTVMIIKTINRNLFNFQNFCPYKQTNITTFLYL